jgi:hypothetical protein
MANWGPGDRWDPLFCTSIAIFLQDMQSTARPACLCSFRWKFSVPHHTATQTAEVDALGRLDATTDLPGYALCLMQLLHGMADYPKCEWCSQLCYSAPSA